MNPPKEETLWKGNPSPVVCAGVFAVCALVALLAVPLAFVLRKWWNGLLLGGLVLWFLIPLAYAFWKWLELRCRVYEITTERVRVSQGVFTKRTDEIELYRVRDTVVLEPFFYRLLRKGNIVLNTSDVNTPMVTLECVPAAQELQDRLRQSVEACRDRKRTRVAEFSGDLEADGEGTPAH